MPILSEVGHCSRSHPGWGLSLPPRDYRQLHGDPTRLRRVSAPTPATLIDHATQEYGRDVVLVLDTTVWWIGSSYERDHTGGALGRHVFEILDGPLRGECVEFVEDRYPKDPDLPHGLPASLRLVE